MRLRQAASLSPATGGWPAADVWTANERTAEDDRLAPNDRLPGEETGGVYNEPGSGQTVGDRQNRTV